MPMVRQFLILTAILGAGSLLPAAEPQDAAPPPPAEQIEFFEKHVRPVLVERCYKCHSAKAEKLKGGLLLDTRPALFKGGDSGPALVSGDPEKSLLVKAIRYADEHLQMPPKEKLPAEEIASLEAWVKMGAPASADYRSPSAGKPGPPVAAALAKATHWAFQPPKSAPVPSVRRKDWVATPIDAFILAKLEEKGLSPAPPTDKRTLLRRATYDLTGLPPTPQDLDAFLADDSPEAFARVIDRLLASPRYGERWGRHWLDVARYADTKEWVVAEERRLPFSYTYRDWVIQAVNDDLPYDQFLRQQIAADKLPSASDKKTLAALGFLTVGRSFLNRQPDQIDDKIDVVSRGLMGLTATCARCHDHKFDPIPTKDYYSLYGVFASSTTPRELPMIGTPARTPEYAAYEKEIHTKEAEITSFKMARHATIVAGFRTPEKIAEYLVAAHETKVVPDEPARRDRDPNKLNVLILKRWMAALKKAAEGHDPVFSPWVAYAAIPEKDFVEKAPAALDGLGDINPIVREAFAEAPTSLKDAAQRYGTLLSSFNKDAAMPDPHMEAIRQAVCAPEAPPNMSLQDVEQFISQDDRGKLKKMRQDMEGSQFHPGAPPRAMALETTPAPHVPKVFIRGNPGTPGDEVPRAFLSILAGEKREAWKSDGRLELAESIAARDNPLTSRVYVNRVWLHHFGAGLVRTPSDFGTRGERPTHPELLDWLAVWFLENGQSSKKLHRLILLSNAYRQSSEGSAEAVKADPQNLLLGRMNRLRLEFEALRDSFLHVSGKLDVAMGGRAVQLTTEPFSARRTVYGYVDRLNLANMFRVFDFAVPDMHAPQRYTTTVPQQALFLMNSPFVMEQAQTLVRRAEIAGETDAEQRIQRLYRLVYGRAATAKEVTLGLHFLSLQTSDPVAIAPAWQYGFGSVDEKTGRIADFTPLPHYTGSAWQGGAKLPDPKTGWCQLTAQGGHAGNDAAHALIRRWTAPRDGIVAIAGTLAHKAEAGDGVRARIVSSGQGELASWTACRLEAETKISGIPVRRGETIDFVIECRADNNSDAFSWAPAIKMPTPDEEWSALSGFGGPPEKLPEPLRPWDKYAQVLLEANEFTFVD
jgi:uncharacterized protein DUF1553/uncharacterized protein DUF1549/cytochrome c